MDPVLLATLLGGTRVGELAGSFSGNQGGMTGGQINDQRFMNDFAWKQSLRQEEFQRDLATHGIRMRVADAEAAGLHPLVGAGINPAGGSPVSVNFGGVGGGGGPNRWERAASVVGQMGQDIGRSITATASADEKAMQALQMERAKSETSRSFAEAAIANRQLQEMLKPPMPQAAYKQYVMPDGTLVWAPTPEYAEGLKVDPVRMWDQSIFRRRTGGTGEGRFSRFRKFHKQVFGLERRK